MSFRSISRGPGESGIRSERIGPDSEPSEVSRGEAGATLERPFRQAHDKSHLLMMQ